MHILVFSSLICSVKLKKSIRYSIMHIWGDNIRVLNFNRTLLFHDVDLGSLEIGGARHLAMATQSHPYFFSVFFNNHPA